MICPYCLQDKIIIAIIKKNKNEIYICEECDTVWDEEVNMDSGIRFDIYMKGKGYKDDWNELHINID